MNSIRAYLVVMLLAVFSLVSFVAALNGYLSSMREAEALLDKQLEYASDLLHLVDRSTVSAGLLEQEEEDIAFQVWRDNKLIVTSTSAPAAPIGEFVRGFSYANFSGYRWRTFTTVDGADVYIVAERADLRHRVAERVVLESVLPLLLWLPVSALLVWLVVGWGLRPLRELSRQINARRSDDLSPVQLQDTPVELRQLLDSTNALLFRLDAAFEREQHFAAHAAHELRTPLSVLKVHLHNLASELPADNEALLHANAGIERMHHLVEQILDLNRTNPEIMRGTFRELDLHSLAQSVMADAWPGFEEKALSVALEGERTPMKGDEGLLQTLLVNLLDNARKYTPAGGEVRVSVLHDADGAILRVEDSGPGIPESECGQVFQRFFRLGTNGGETTGSGLGLAIVEHIVQVHQAQVGLGRSGLGGLRVEICFPIARGPDS